MRYATVEIPGDQYSIDDSALRWQGQRVELRGPYEELTKHPDDRQYWNVYCPKLASSTIMPKTWLKEAPF